MKKYIDYFTNIKIIKNRTLISKEFFFFTLFFFVYIERVYLRFNIFICYEKS